MVDTFSFYGKNVSKIRVHEDGIHEEVLTQAIPIPDIHAGSDVGSEDDNSGDEIELPTKYNLVKTLSDIFYKTITGTWVDFCYRGQKSTWMVFQNCQLLCPRYQNYAYILYFFEECCVAVPHITQRRPPKNLELALAAAAPHKI